MFSIANILKYFDRQRFYLINCSLICIKQKLQWSMILSVSNRFSRTSDKLFMYLRNCCHGKIYSFPWYVLWIVACVHAMQDAKAFFVCFLSQFWFCAFFYPYSCYEIGSFKGFDSSAISTLFTSYEASRHIKQLAIWLFFFRQVFHATIKENKLDITYPECEGNAAVPSGFITKDQWCEKCFKCMAFASSWCIMEWNYI